MIQPTKTLGPPRPKTFSYVGRVLTLKPWMGLTAGEVPGKVALVLTADWGDMTVAYFDPARCPRIGAKVGAVGTWLLFDVEPANLCDCDLCEEGTPVDIQLEVEHWEAVPVDYDPLCL